MSLEGGNYEEPIKKPLLADAASDMAKKIQSQNPDAKGDPIKKADQKDATGSNAQNSEGLPDRTEAKNALKLTPDQQKSADANALLVTDCRTRCLDEALFSQKGATNGLIKAEQSNIGWA